MGSGDYRSPAGTWEPIRKSVLEDFTLSCAAFRLMAYLATKPASWVINEEHLIRVTGWPTNRVRQGLRDLRKRGYLDEAVERKPSGVIVRREWTLRRDVVVSAGHDLDEGNLDASKPDSSYDQGERKKPQVVTPMHSSLTQAQLGASKSSAIEKTESFSEDGVSSEDGTTPHDQLPLIVGVRTDKAKRGSRIPDDFRQQLLADETAADWFRENCPDVNGRQALDEFIDYWKGVSGQRGCKLDWIATWRNRMRKKQEDATRYQSRGAARLAKANQVVQNNRVNGQPSDALKAFGHLAGHKPTEESRREITS